MPGPAKALGQLSGIDRNRASGSAQAIHRAGIERRVGEIGFERGESPVSACVLQALHLAPHDDALARRRGQIPARTLGLAVAALDALIDLVFDYRHALQ